MRRNRLVAVAVASALAGCLAFSDLTGGSTGLDDAGNDSGDAADEGASDATGFEDVFVPPLVDASFCALSDATFCDDFDTAALAVRWTGRNLRGGGTVDQYPLDSSPSAPNVLRADIPDAGPGIYPWAFISRQFNGTFTHLDLGFDLFVAKADAFFYGSVWPIAINSPTGANPESSLTIHLYAGSALATESHDFADGGAIAAQSPNWFDSPHVGKWQHLELAIDLAEDGGAALLTVTLDGVIVEVWSMSKTWQLGPTIGLQLGITYPYSTNAEWDLRFDNVTVNTR